MVTALSLQQQEEIVEAIRQAELRTEGEIVIVIAEQSGDYRAASLGVSVAISIIVAFLLWMFTAMQSFPEFCLVQLALIVTLDFLLQESGAILRLVPSSTQIRAAARNAKAQFFHHQLHATDARAAILLFISQKERYAELIPDIGIRNKETPEIWQGFTNQFLQQIKVHPSKAILTTIQSCSALLEKHFPLTGNNPNELSDAILHAV